MSDEVNNTSASRLKERLEDIAGTLDAVRLWQEKGMLAVEGSQDRRLAFNNMNHLLETASSGVRNMAREVSNHRITQPERDAARQLVRSNTPSAGDLNQRRALERKFRTC